MPASLRRFNLLLLLLVSLLAGACSKTPLSGDALQYVGYWQSYNGSTLEIMANGGGRGKKLGFDGDMSSSKELNGAQVVVKGHTISLEMMGISMDYHVDAPPTLVDGKTHLKLDGIDYVKMN